MATTVQRRSNHTTKERRWSSILFKAAAMVGACIILLMNVVLCYSLLVTQHGEKDKPELPSPLSSVTSSLQAFSSSNNPPKESTRTSLAHHQSFGFFDNIGDKDWKLLQTITAEHENHRFPDKPFTYNPHFDKRKEKWWNSYPAWW